MFRWYLIGLALLLVSPGTGNAAWHEASSRNFVIYANQKGERVRAFADRLEKYHAAMAYLLRREPESPSPSNRVTVFVVSSTSNVRKLADMKSKYVAGVYRPNAGNIVAIVPKLRSGGSDLSLSSETILRHEYAHHFMFNVSSRSFPLWYQEGFAEFFASGRVDRKGTVILGAPASHRAFELVYSDPIPITLLLDTAGYRKNKSDNHDQFYGRSWILYHYLTFEPSRKGQLSQFARHLDSGMTELEAAQKAFGDLEKLDAELKRYGRKRRMTALGIPSDRLNTGTVQIRRLSDGEAAMMPVIMESRTGVDEEEAMEVVAEARPVAAKYPDDPAVQEALAEAEFDAGYLDEAIAAADRALALDSKRVRAQIQKIYAHARKAEDADDSVEAWKEVRRQIVVANRIETNHPIPLIEYFRTYESSGTRPPELAVQGLERALEIAPFDGGLRWMVANQQLTEERYADASRTLKPLAHSPHKNSLTSLALKLMETIEQKAAAKAAARNEQAGE